MERCRHASGQATRVLQTVNGRPVHRPACGSVPPVSILAKLSNFIENSVHLAWL